MIKFDGCYIEEPVVLIDERDKDNTHAFAFVAYVFYEDNILVMRTKSSTLNELLDFEKSEFDTGDIKYQKLYNIKNNLIHIPARKSYQKDRSLTIVSTDELYNKGSKKSLTFVSWKELEDYNGKFLFAMLKDMDTDKLETKFV